jgi:hypothetical protein
VPASITATKLQRQSSRADIKPRPQRRLGLALTAQQSKLVVVVNRPAVGIDAMSRIQIENLASRIGKHDLLQLLDTVGGLPGRRVGKIELGGGRATVEVPADWQARVAKALDGASLAGRRIRAWPVPDAHRGPGGDHFARLLALLELERQAEAERALNRTRRLSLRDAERGGEALVELVIVDEDAGLGGRYLLALAKPTRGPLPWNRLDAGSPAVLLPEDPAVSLSLRGVVYERGRERISIAVTTLPEQYEEVERWRLVLSSDEISSQRQRGALERASAATRDRTAELREILLGHVPARFDPVTEETPLDDSLNASQQAAIDLALAARDVALVHGPPGTGKTTTLVELIRRAVRRGRKVLACGPSNLAVDNLFERLLGHGEHVVRLGHPARVLPELRSQTLDLLVEKHNDVRVARKLVKDALAMFRRAARTTRAKPEPGARREMRIEARALLADARRLEAQAVQHILDTADILCATTTGLDDELLGDRRFDLVVIDEACQSTEPGCWLALLRAERVVLAGDHKQLPPTVLSDEAARGGYGASLFERLTEQDASLVRRLDVQYRMHQAIMDFSSLEFYDADLLAHESVRAHLLADLPEIQRSALTEAPLLFVDTAGAGYDEEPEPDGESRRNPREAQWIAAQARLLVEHGLAPSQIGIITPYAAQARLLRELLPGDAWEVDTVDGFQGREKEAILISLVRSNDRHEVGFLSDVRRMNVAMTRARRKLTVVGDSATLAGEPFYARLIEHFERQGAYRSIWEELGP